VTLERKLADNNGWPPFSAIVKDMRQVRSLVVNKEEEKICSLINPFLRTQCKSLSEET
jgi:hypothetical protein